MGVGLNNILPSYRIVSLNIESEICLMLYDNNEVTTYCCLLAAMSAHGCRKTKKIVRGMEGENVVAYGRLPFPAFCVYKGKML